MVTPIEPFHSEPRDLSSHSVRRGWGIRVMGPPISGPPPVKKEDLEVEGGKGGCWYVCESLLGFV